VFEVDLVIFIPRYLICRGMGKSTDWCRDWICRVFLQSRWTPRSPPFRIAQLDQTKQIQLRLLHIIFAVFLSGSLHGKCLNSEQDHESNPPFSQASVPNFILKRQHYGRKTRLHLAERQPAQEKQVLPLQN
jgi:hypothetical protein